MQVAYGNPCGFPLYVGWVAFDGHPCGWGVVVDLELQNEVLGDNEVVEDVGVDKVEEVHEVVEVLDHRSHEKVVEVR
jgi:hypothetical protein